MSKLFGKEVLPDVRETVTDKDGAFELSGLRSGSYLVTANSVGYGLRHTPQGPSDYQAGATGITVVVSPRYLAHCMLVDDATGEPVSVANLIVEYTVPNEPNCRWDISSTVDQVLGESAVPGQVGEIRQHFQASNPPTTPPEAEVSVISIQYEPVVAKVPLEPIGSDAQAHTIRLRRLTESTGTIRLSIPTSTRPVDVNPYPLLLRLEGDVDERWRRVSIALGASGEGRAIVPSGKYRLGGPFVYLVDDISSGTVVVPKDGEVSVVADVAGDVLGSLELTVMSESGVRLSDFYYRLVPYESYSRGQDNPIKQGWIGGEPPLDGPDVSANWIAAKEYAVIITKRGWAQHIGRLTITGGETTKYAVDLSEE